MKTYSCPENIIRCLEIRLSVRHMANNFWRKHLKDGKRCLASTYAPRRPQLSELFFISSIVVIPLSIRVRDANTWEKRWLNVMGSWGVMTSSLFPHVWGSLCTNYLKVSVSSKCNFIALTTIQYTCPFKCLRQLRAVSPIRDERTIKYVVYNYSTTPDFSHTELSVRKDVRKSTEPSRKRSIF